MIANVRALLTLYVTNTLTLTLSRHFLACPFESRIDRGQAHSYFLLAHSSRSQRVKDSTQSSKMYADSFPTAQTSSWELASRNASNYRLRSEQVPQNTPMSSGRDMVPYSQYDSSSQTKFDANETLLQQLRKWRNQWWSPESFQTAPKTPQSLRYKHSIELIRR